MFNPRTRRDRPMPASGLADSEATCSQSKLFHSSRAKLLQRNKLKERTRWPSLPTRLPPSCPPLRAQHRPKSQRDTPAHWQRIAPICPPTCRTASGFGGEKSRHYDKMRRKVNSENLPASSCPGNKHRSHPRAKGLPAAQGRPGRAPHTQGRLPRQRRDGGHTEETNYCPVSRRVPPVRCPPVRAAAPQNPLTARCSLTAVPFHRGCGPAAPPGRPPLWEQRGGRQTGRSPSLPTPTCPHRPSSAPALSHAGSGSFCPHRGGPTPELTSPSRHTRPPGERLTASSEERKRAPPSWRRAQGEGRATIFT